jgi:hypothetical protein
MGLSFTGRAEKKDVTLKKALSILGRKGIE